MKRLLVGLVLLSSASSFGQCWTDLSRFLAIKSDGTMWSFANGDTVQVGTDSDWWRVSAGYDHYLAIKTDSTLWGWGNHDHGQLGAGFGNGVPLVYPNPTSLGADHDWVQVSAGNYTSMFLKANGDLYASGENYYGQLGIGGTATQWTIVPVQSIGGNVKNVSTGSNGTFAVKQDGTLWFAGTRYFLDENDGNNQLTFEQQGTATDWDTVATGLGHYLLLKTNGQLWAGGLNNSGQVGNGTYQDVNGTVQIGAEYWSNISVQMFNSAGLKADGTLYYWGGNNQISTPTQIGTANDYTNTSNLMATRTYGLYWIASGNNHLIDGCGLNINVEEMEVNDWVLFPNPSIGKVAIQGSFLTVDAVIYDAMGKAVSHVNQLQPYETIDISTLQKGTYTVCLHENGKTTRQLLVIQ